MLEIATVLLMVVALVLFFMSRRQLSRTKEKARDHDQMAEMESRVLKYSKEGKTKEEIITEVGRDYGLQEEEARYLYRRTMKRKGMDE